jgi:signal transduction histidine kinase
MGAVAVGALVLNKYRAYKSSKAIFLLSWIVLITILVPAINGTHEDSYILHPFYCILSSVMVHIIFSYHKERALYITFSVFTWVLIIGSVDLITYFLLPDSEPTRIFVNGFFKWRVMTFMFAAFFNIIMIYVLQINYRFYARLQRQHETIAAQNKKLEEQRESLEKLTSQLENKVAAGTEIVKKQNDQIIEYSFFNSHILRAPVSRIRGLLNLLSHKQSAEEEMRIRSLLSDSMIELDNAIKSINDKLNEADNKF